ncbi:hypothetical protein [Aliarcobacter butzleri]|uniref:hypothetical protein n=1 Tax=Aliarcobacter butzleri TaxID=28197 RepID=UPI00126059C0|nr:hypothetical protein [Aliarcobacter butzleri]
MIKLNQEEINLLNQYYNLKIEYINIESDCVDLKVLHNQDELETILNSMIKEVQEVPNFINVFKAFYSKYLTFDNLNQNLLEKIKPLL